MNSQLALRQRLWRWHFFAGLIVCPFACLLA
ncbi:MAG: putative iron-regulated membrane protein, partial [Parasphingorhabdus sp.]